jgi:hypothetical protein
MIAARAVDWPLTFEALANFLQSAAILIGGWWTYRLFVRQRQHRDRANVSHSAVCKVLDDEWVLLRVDICVQNVGQVRITPSRAKTIVYQVLPVAPELASYIRGDTSEGIRKDLGFELPWPVLRNQPWKLTQEFWLEPGESDRLFCDFTLPRTVRSVLVLTQLFCGPEGDENWRTMTLHDLEPAG